MFAKKKKTIAAKNNHDDDVEWLHYLKMNKIYKYKIMVC